MAKNARQARRTGDAGLDEALADSFPTSDPPAHTNPSRSVRAARKTAREISDACLDEALAETFPASDTPAQTNPVKGTRRNPNHVK